MWNYTNEWPHYDEKVIEKFPETVIYGGHFNGSEWPENQILVANSSFKEFPDVVKTPDRISIKLTLIEPEKEAEPVRDTAGIVILGQKDRIYTFDEYTEFLKTKYYDLEDDDRSKIEMFPPLARGTAAEIYTACTRKHVKTFKNLTDEQQSKWKQIWKDSKTVLNKATTEYNKLLKDQLRIYYEMRQKRIADGRWLKLSAEEVAAVKKSFNVKTDALAELAHFAVYLGCEKTLETDDPEIENVENVAFNGNHLQDISKVSTK